MRVTTTTNGNSPTYLTEDLDATEAFAKALLSDVEELRGSRDELLEASRRVQEGLPNDG